MLVQDDPLFDNHYPENYPWRKVANTQLRETAKLLAAIVNDPMSLENQDNWEKVAIGVKIALRVISRHATVCHYRE